MRRRAPPPPTSSLDVLLARVRADLARVEMDADFPRRIEAAIRARRRRTLPGWAALAAAILLALGAALLKGGSGPLRACAPGPGPGPTATVPGPGAQAEPTEANGRPAAPAPHTGRAADGPREP